MLASLRYFILKRRGREWELLRVLFGSLIFATGLAACSVLVLTTPPAYDKLSDETRVIVGVVVTVICIAFFVREVWSFLAPDSDDEPPSPPDSGFARSLPVTPPSKPKGKRNKSMAAGR